MRIQSSRFPGLVGALLVAGSLTGSAEFAVYKGVTVTRHDALSYLSSSGETEHLRGSRKSQQYAVISTLGSPGYALYTVDLKAKQAFRSTGNLSTGGSVYPNYQNRGVDYEVHKQFNKSWSYDIPDLGDGDDIWNVKAGSIGGLRRQINLRNAGFALTAAPKLQGSHTHTECSDDFGFDVSTPSGYAPGKFFQLNFSRTTLKLDIKLTDQTNVLGGSLGDGMFVVDELLDSKNIEIIPVLSLNF